MQEHELRLGITDVQLRLTPLEEVFTAVARQAEVQHAQETKETTELVISEGNVLQVCYCSKCSTAQHNLARWHLAKQGSTAGLYMGVSRKLPMCVFLIVGMQTDAATFSHMNHTCTASLT